jgi:hypothetical protein
VVLGIAVVIPSAQRARAAGAFDGVASADGVRVGLVVPGSPVSDTLVDAGGPSSQARLDSLGSSRAFASFPYPGDLVVSLPGLLAGLTGAPVPLPAYPLYVAADHPSASSATLETPPAYRIAATATQDAAGAEATVGIDGADVLGAIRARTRANVTSQEDGTVLAEARSETDGVAIGPLRIGSIRTRARATLGTDGAVSLDHDVEIGGMTVDGVPIGLGPDGPTVLGTAVPLPGLDLPADALAAAGITLELLEPVKDGTTVTAPILRLVLAGADVPGSGPSRLIVSLGGATASLSGAPASTATSAPSTGSNPVTDAGPTGGAVASPIGAVPVFPAPSAADAELPAASPVEASAGRVPVRFDLADLYLIVAGLGLAGGLASQLVRVIGVRMPWTS